MKAVRRLMFTVVTIFNSIELSIQSGYYHPMPRTSYQQRMDIVSIEQKRFYQSWTIPAHTGIQVYAEQNKCLYTLEVNKEYCVLRSNGPGYREVFAIKIFGAGYAIYDRRGIRSAIQTNGNTRHLAHWEEMLLDDSHSMFKIPANGLPEPCTTALNAEFSTIPPFLQGRSYGHWMIPLGVTVKVIQNLPRGSQRLYILDGYKKFDVLRNGAYEVFAIKELNQLHLLYDKNDVQTVFHMITGIPRKLSSSEEKYFYTLPETIKQTATLEELRANALKKRYRQSQDVQHQVTDHSSSSGS